MPLKEMSIGKDRYTERYSALIGKLVRVYTDGGFALGILENINVEGITLRPSLVNETLTDKTIYRLEKDLPQIIEILSLKGMSPLSEEHLENLLKLYHPKNKNQLELF